MCIVMLLVVYVIGDVVCIEQVIVNFLCNVFDVVEEVFCKCVCVILEVDVECQQVVLCICDFGVGIVDEVVLYLFEFFFMIKLLSKGLGLGLVIFLFIVQVMNGQLSVYNYEYGGVEFVVCLLLLKMENEFDG